MLQHCHFIMDWQRHCRKGVAFSGEDAQGGFNIVEDVNLQRDTLTMTCLAVRRAV